jgi:hypothetical protein
MRLLAAALMCLCSATAFAGRVSIVSPSNGEVILDSEGRVAVTLNSSLIPGEAVRVLVNGVAVRTYGEGERRLLLNVDRGEHRLEAEVVDEKGAVVATSAPVTINLIRPSAAAGSRGAPPAPAPSDTTLVPVNPATTVGAPNPNNPPGTIGAPNPNNPPGMVGVPNTNVPATGVGAPGVAGPNNPAATVGRPAASAPGR